MNVRIEVEAANTLPLDSLVEFQGNLKELSKQNYEKLKKDILTLGFSSPIHVWKNENQFFCLDGHQRIRTLKKMQEEGFSIPQIPVVFVHAKNKKEAKQKILSLTSHFGKITNDGLYEFINESGLDFKDVKDDFNFHEIDFDNFEKEFYDESGPVEGEDDVPEVRKTDIKYGDLFILGNHRLYCGDATKIEDVEKLMGGEKVDMIYTDPPYGMNLDTDYASMHEKEVGPSSNAKAKAGTRPNKWRPIEGDDKEFDPSFILETFEDADEVFIWGADYFYQNLPKGGCFLIWDKNNGNEGADKILGVGYEICWSKLRHRQVQARIFGRGTFGHDKVKIHPTQKPVQLHEWFFERWGKDKTNIVDLYLGSGSTLIACEKTNRKCFGMEIDPQYVQNIIDRWEKFTGKKANKILTTEVEPRSKNDKKSITTKSSRTSKRAHYK